MTTVIAHAAPGSVWMAADGCTNVYDRPVPTAAKILKATTRDGHDYLLGFAGEGAGPTVVAANLTVDAFPATSDRPELDAWAGAVARAITEIFIEHSLLEGGRLDSTMVLGIPGQLWTITHHQAIRHADGLAAVGSGEGPAIGALHAFLECGIDPATAVHRACEAGIRFDRFSEGPVAFEKLTDDPEQA